MFKLVKEIKSKNGELHFRRWKLFSTSWFNVYIHAIYEADEDKHCHCHPWNFFSLILWGGYDEQICNNVRAYIDDDVDEILAPVVEKRFFSWSFKRAEEVHKISALFRKPTYTLVITGSRKREWGYKTEKGWIDNVTYRNLKNDNKL